MSDIFVSYTQADRQRVEDLVHALETRGFDVWWDRDIVSGDNYHRVIEQALADARCALVVWSRTAIRSEWVVNEASEARRRGILVPVVLDDTEPPLAFRHLQAARLDRWRGTIDAPELQPLMSAVQAILAKQGVDPRATVTPPGPSSAGRSWWETPAGWALGIAALVGASAALLSTLGRLELIGPPRLLDEPAVLSSSAERTVEERAPAATPPFNDTDRASAGERESSQTINLLDPGHGARIVASNEAGWKDYIFARDVPYCSIISTRGFVTFAFRDERTARFDRLGVFVEATSDYNVKTVELHASDASDQGPFARVGSFAVPNFRNERQPLHEFTFDPVTARYVKLVAVDWQAPSIPNGNVCTMALYGVIEPL